MMVNSCTCAHLLLANIAMTLDAVFIACMLHLQLCGNLELLGIAVPTTGRLQQVK